MLSLLVFKKIIISPFSAALDVNLKEEGFPEQDFEVVKGNLNVKWERIAPYPLETLLYWNYLNIHEHLHCIEYLPYNY